LNQSFAHHALLKCAVYCLVALAALAALAAAGGAMAQVTIAGQMDTAYYSYDGKSRDGTLRLAGQGVGDGSWAGSRIRFSGVEDLGGGTKASFWLEQGISPTTGDGMNYRTGGNVPQASGLSSSGSGGIRQAYIGLEGSMGTLRVGRVYAALYEYMAVTPTTQLAGIPSASVHINGEYTGTYNAAWAAFSRTKGINYQSPTFGGNFKYYGTYGGIDNATESISSENSGLVTGNVNGQAYQSVSSKAHTHRLTYLKNALRLAIVYQRQDTANGLANSAAVASYYGPGLIAVGAAPSTQVATQDTNYLAGYNLGWLDVTGAYGTRTADTSTTGQGATTSVATNYSQLNFRAPMGKFELRYTWNKASGESTAVATGVKTNTIDWNGSLIGVGYHFSARTKGYLFSGQEKEEVAAQGNTNNITRTALGIAHSF